VRDTNVACLFSYYLVVYHIYEANFEEPWFHSFLA